MYCTYLGPYRKEGIGTSCRYTVAPSGPLCSPSCTAFGPFMSPIANRVAIPRCLPRGSRTLRASSAALNRSIQALLQSLPAATDARNSQMHPEGFFSLPASCQSLYRKHATCAADERRRSAGDAQAIEHCITSFFAESPRLVPGPGALLAGRRLSTVRFPPGLGLGSPTACDKVLYIVEPAPCPGHGSLSRTTTWWTYAQTCRINEHYARWPITSSPCHPTHRPCQTLPPEKRDNRQENKIWLPTPTRYDFRPSSRAA